MDGEDTELTTTFNPSSSEETLSVYPDDSISARDVPTTTVERAISEISGGPSLMSTLSTGLSFTTNDPLFRMMGGRVFSNQSDLYQLPADDDEHSRLDLQHFAVSIQMDSLYPFGRLVRQAIRMDQELSPAVLDVGTGSGRWAVDMAVNYPWVKVKGMDLVPPALLRREDIPKNCEFEIDDANLSLEHYDGAFNVVHVRSIDPGLNDHESFIYEMARTLRPNGILILGAGNVQLFDEDHQPVPFVQPGEPKFSWVQFTFYHVQMAHINHGSYGANARRYWRYWVQNNPNYKEHHYEHYDLPIGPWKEGLTEKEAFASNLMREDLARIIPAYRQLLLVDHEEADVDYWIKNALQELRELTQRAYCQWTFVGAVRGDHPWQPREVPLVPVDLWDNSMVVHMDNMNPVLKSG